MLFSNFDESCLCLHITETRTFDTFIWTNTNLLNVGIRLFYGERLLLFTSLTAWNYNGNTWIRRHLIRLLTTQNGFSIRHVLFKIIELFERFISLFLDKLKKLFRMILSLTMSGILSGDIIHSWWRHKMETFSALLALCAGNYPHKGQWREALMFSLIYT